MRCRAFAILLALCGIAWTNGVRAEAVLAPQHAIKLAPGPLLAPAVLGDLRSPENGALRRDVRRARGLLMVGSGLIAAAIVNGAVFGPQTYCHAYDDPVRRPKVAPIASSVVAGIGIGLTIGGGIKLARLPAGFRQARPASPGRVALLALGALASAGAGTALLALVSAPEMISCAS